MREIRTSGLTSGDWKRGGILIVHQPATAPVIDSTRQLDPNLLCVALLVLLQDVSNSIQQFDNNNLEAHHER